MAILWNIAYIVMCLLYCYITLPYTTNILLYCYIVLQYCYTRNRADKEANNELKALQNLSKKEKRETNNQIILRTIQKEFEEFDIIQNLPVEISEKILLLLGKDDVPSAYNCSSSWRNVMSGNYFWKKRCQLDNYHVTAENKRSIFYRQYLKDFDFKWQGLYSYNHMLLNNWKNNNFKQIIPSDSLNDSPTGIHYLNENVLIISTSKFNLKVMDAATGNIMKMMLGNHETAIVEVFKIDNYLISYDNNCIFKVWDLSKNGLCITKQLVPGYIRKMSVSKNVIALEATHHSREIFVYDFKGTLMYRRNVNAKFSTFACLNDKILVIATRNNEVNISELNSERIISSTFSVLKNIKDIKIKNGNFLCIFYLTCIRVYDTETSQYLHEMNICNYNILGYMDQDKIISNDGDDRFIIVWDITTGHRIMEITNLHSMKYITGNSRFIVTHIPYIRLIKVWSCDTKQVVTEISLKAIGLKNHLIISAYITNSKLVLLCRLSHRQTCLVMLNFENTANVVFPISAS